MTDETNNPMDPNMDPINNPASEAPAPEAPAADPMAPEAPAEDETPSA